MHFGGAGNSSPWSLGERVILRWLSDLVRPGWLKSAGGARKPPLLLITLVPGGAADGAPKEESVATLVPNTLLVAMLLGSNERATGVARACIVWMGEGVTSAATGGMGMGMPIGLEPPDVLCKGLGCLLGEVGAAGV